MGREPTFPGSILVPKRQSCACLRDQYTLRKITRHSSHLPRLNLHSARGTAVPTSRDFVPWRFLDAAATGRGRFVMPASKNLHRTRHSACLRARASAFRIAASLDPPKCSGCPYWILSVEAGGQFRVGDGFEQRFGLYHVDFDTKRRMPKLSASFYRETIRAKRRGLIRNSSILAQAPTHRLVDHRFQVQLIRPPCVGDITMKTPTSRPRGRRNRNCRRRRPNGIHRVASSYSG